MGKVTSISQWSKMKCVVVFCEFKLKLFLSFNKFGTWKLRYWSFLTYTIVLAMLSLPSVPHFNSNSIHLPLQHWVTRVFYLPTVARAMIFLLRINYHSDSIGKRPYLFWGRVYWTIYDLAFNSSSLLHPGLSPVVHGFALNRFYIFFALAHISALYSCPWLVSWAQFFILFWSSAH